MARLAVGYGAFLVVLGVGGYFESGRVSLTALIPCAFGLPILVMAVMALRRPKLAQYMMHGILVLALFAVLGTASSFPALLTLLSGGEVQRAPAVIAKALMASVSMLFLGLGINSFVQVRRRRALAS